MDSWHLNKSVSISIIIGLLLNVTSFVWYASKMDSRVSTLEQARISHEQVIKSIEADRKNDSKDVLMEIRNLRENIIEIKVLLGQSEIQFEKKK